MTFLGISRIFLIHSSTNRINLANLNLFSSVANESDFIQPSSNSALESRVESLEKQLALLQKSIPAESEKCDGPDEIRTHDPRRVKAMS